MLMKSFTITHLQAAQIEAERQRQLEWEKRKKEELLNHKNMEQDIVNNLKSRVQKLEEELLKVVSSVHITPPGINNDKTFVFKVQSICRRGLGTLKKHPLSLQSELRELLYKNDSNYELRTILILPTLHLVLYLKCFHAISKAS